MPMTVEDLFHLCEDLMETDPHAEVLIRGDRQDPFYYEVATADVSDSDPRVDDEDEAEASGPVVLIQM